MHRYVLARHWVWYSKEVKNLRKTLKRKAGEGSRFHDSKKSKILHESQGQVIVYTVTFHSYLKGSQMRERFCLKSQILQSSEPRKINFSEPPRNYHINVLENPLQSDGATKNNSRFLNLQFL